MKSSQTPIIPNYVQEIWDNIVNTPEALPLSEAEKSKLDERLENYNRNPNEGTSWETLKNILSQTK